MKQKEWSIEVTKDTIWIIHHTCNGADYMWGDDGQCNEWECGGCGETAPKEIIDKVENLLALERKLG